MFWTPKTQLMSILAYEYWFHLHGIEYLLNLAKGLGEARRVDEAFQMLESIDKGSAFGGLQLSAHVIYGLLNSLLQSGLPYDLVNPFSSLLYYQRMKWFRFFQTKKILNFALINYILFLCGWFSFLVLHILHPQLNYLPNSLH